MTLALAVFALTAPVAHGQVTGRAVALSGDVLQIGGQTFQLWGVDAVEFQQSCYVDGRPWACGASAVRAFQTLIDPVVVTCTPTGEGSVDAPIAICSSDEGDLAEIMTRRGWARAHGLGADNYAAAEESARADGIGIWQGRFVDPWEYREDIASLERAYAVQVAEGLANEAESRLAVNGDSSVPFQGFAVSRVDAADPVVSAAEITLGVVPYGGVRDAGGPREVFDWRVVADALWAWQQEILYLFELATAATFWDEFNDLPGPIVEAVDAITFYNAMTEEAAPLIAAGRQPVLLVSSTQSPGWISDWLLGSPPEGASVLRKEEPTAPSYRGTISGVDIHVGPAPWATSLIFPDDILVGIAYGEMATGSFATMEIDPVANPDELVIRYFRTLDWSNDPILRISFPADVEEDPFYEVEVLD